MVDGANGGSGGPSPEPVTPGPSTVFTGLAEIIYQGSDPADVYAAIYIAATLIVPGCDHASLLVRRNDHYVTVGASDDVAQRIEDLERSAGDGPCVDAIEEETPQIETDLTTPNDWPKLAGRLLAETPVRGAMGFRVLVAKRKPVRSTCSATPPTSLTPSQPAEPSCWRRSPAWPSTRSLRGKMPPPCYKACSATGKSARLSAC
jgi:hypothetical protein